MRQIKKIICVASLILSLDCTASAQQPTTLTEPTVEYSADLIEQTTETITSHTIPMKRRTDDPRAHSLEFNPPTSRTSPTVSRLTKVYKAPGKERKEAGGKIYISRFDKNIIWIVMPERKQFVEMPLNWSLPILSPLNPTEMTEVGEEVLDGHQTKKSKVLVTNADGTLFDGFIWTTPENIVIKTEGVCKIGENTLQSKRELKNLNIGKQNPSLFEIPEGYSDIRELLTTEEKKEFDNNIELMMGVFGLVPSNRP